MTGRFNQQILKHVVSVRATRLVKKKKKHEKSLLFWKKWRDRRLVRMLRISSILFVLLISLHQRISRSTILILFSDLFRIPLMFLFELVFADHRPLCLFRGLHSFDPGRYSKLLSCFNFGSRSVPFVSFMYMGISDL